MSRDWTPQELYQADLYMSKEGKSLRNLNGKFVDNKGNEFPFKSKAEVEIGKKYPQLSFLFPLWFETYTQMDNEMIRDALFASLEKWLNEIISDEDSVESLPKSQNSKRNETVLEWYHGELDDSFYYNECNNELFQNYILQSYKTLEEYRLYL